MNLSFAPLEGITTYTYRNTHFEMFGGCDEYYAPFISPSDNEKVSKKGIRDILKENNPHFTPKVQVITANPVSFLKFEEKIKAFGYNEVNLNAGCPASTVVKKSRGAGFLCDREHMESFFHEIFDKTELKVTVKTRIGFSSLEEYEKIIEIYNKFPVGMLIVHPRLREEYYKGVPHLEIFKRIAEISKNPLCYNGNVYSSRDAEYLKNQFPHIESIMIGRGAIKNPAIFREIKGGKPVTTGELVEFSHALIKNYNELLDTRFYTLLKMKEIWMYMMQNYPDEAKILKAIKKAKKLEELINAVNCLPEIKEDYSLKIIK